MPANSYLGQKLVSTTQQALASFSWAPTDTIAFIRGVPVTPGTAAKLPSSPPASDCDYYAWSNDDGSCSPTHPIVLTPPAGSGQTIGGAASLTLVTPFTAGVAIFDAATKNWNVFTTTANPSSGGQFLVVPFTLATASPLVLANLNIGSKVILADVVITTAFDGVAPALTLGTAASPSALFASGEVDPKTAGTYGNQDVFVAPAASPLQLGITPSASTVGAGLVVLALQL